MVPILLREWTKLRRRRRAPQLGAAVARESAWTARRASVEQVANPRCATSTEENTYTAIRRHDGAGIAGTYARMPTRQFHPRSRDRAVPFGAREASNIPPSTVICPRKQQHAAW